MKHSFIELRNIAIIAHVDHGKTTLVDALLKETGAFRTGSSVEDRVLDSNPLERERGITILAKNTGVFFHPDENEQPIKINIVDTPGHADFGGEVERILSMVDGCLLVVDAAEGPMPQTRYVLQKALDQRLHPVVVINKIDRPDARVHEVIDEVLELFITLRADDDQIDFPLIYAAARAGVADDDLDRASAHLSANRRSMRPLFHAIVQHVPAPRGQQSAHAQVLDAPLQLMVTMLDHDDYVGRIAVGRMNQGALTRGQRIVYGRPDGPTNTGVISHLFTFERLQRVPVEQAMPGEIVAVAGIEHLGVGDTVTEVDRPLFLPPLTVDDPTLSVVFRVNDSPLAGQDGTYLTSRHLRERLYREARNNVALQVNDTESADAFRVAGRGELHLGILIETMRRDGYEFAVSQPQVVFKHTDEGRQEPLERLTVEVPQQYVGAVMDMVGSRKGDMLDMTPLDDETTRIEFVVPARGLVGFHSQLLSETKGFGVSHHTFHAYGPDRGDLPGRPHGSLVSWEDGAVTAHALESAQERGQLFVVPGDIVYQGMVVGANNRPEDLDVNVCRRRHVTNIRSSTAEITTKLDAPRTFTVEEALAYIAPDELVEVTPARIRLRKAILDRQRRHAVRKKSRN